MTDIKKLEKKIGFTFTKPSLIQSALTHESYLNEHEITHDSYERLEFFGDAILEFVASEYIYKHFKKIREGRLTEIRAALVRTETLAKCAKKLELGTYLQLSKGEEANNGRLNDNILADAVEALIAVIYLDKGIEASRRFFDNFLREEVEEIVTKELFVDPKSKFQEFVQEKLKVTPQYKLIAEKTEGSDTVFTMGLYVSDKLISEGDGKNKKIAERNAAINALGKLSEL
ncbi:MAG: ribonuclease III [Patescibacteria group bacterium]|jgi:ribonuclease-3